MLSKEPITVKTKIFGIVVKVTEAEEADHF
jgi:hypothetical protein